MEINNVIEILEAHKEWIEFPEKSKGEVNKFILSKAIGLALGKLIQNINAIKPTSFEKNNLPDDVKYAFNEGVEIYQAVMSYEIAIINKSEFIEEIRKIKNSYRNN